MKLVRGVLLFPIIALVWTWDILSDLCIIVYNSIRLVLTRIHVYLLLHSRYMRDRQIINAKVTNRKRDCSPNRSFLLRN